jgi:hypothetical protein
MRSARPSFGCGFGRARNCEVSQATAPANELCEPPGPGDGISYSPMRFGGIEAVIDFCANRAFWQCHLHG